MPVHFSASLCGLNVESYNGFFFIFMRAISGAFHLLWLFFDIMSSVVFHDSGSETAMSNKAAWRSGGSPTLILSEIGKNALVKTDIRRTDEWCCQDGRLRCERRPTPRRRGCHFSFTLLYVRRNLSKEAQFNYF